MAIRTRSYFLLFCMFAIFFGSSAPAWTETEEERPFRVGYFEIAPHIELDAQNNLTGPALDYIKLALKEMNVEKYEMKGYPVQRTFKMLLLGEIDIVLFAAKTPRTNDGSLVLTDIDLTYIQPGLIVKSQDFDTEPLDFKHLLNKRLAYWSGGYLPDFLRHETIELIAVAGKDVYKRGFKLINYDRADGFFHADSMALEWWLINTKDAEGLKLLTLPYKLKVKSVFSKRSATRYKERFEAAMTKVQQKISYRDFFFQYKKHQNGDE